MGWPSLLYIQLSGGAAAAGAAAGAVGAAVAISVDGAAQACARQEQRSMQYQSAAVSYKPQYAASRLVLAVAAPRYKV